MCFRNRILTVMAVSSVALVALEHANADERRGVTAISGRINFKGDAGKYERVVIDASADPKCRQDN